MSEGSVNGSQPKPSDQTVNRGQAAYNAFAQTANLLLAYNVPMTAVIDLLFDVACNLVAAIEPAPLRQSIIDNIRNNLPVVVERHYTMRHSTPGGVFVPPNAG